MATGYFNFSSEFWNGETGRELRKLGALTQLTAIYLFTGPSAEPLGLYYLPLPTLMHHLAIDPAGARAALQQLTDIGFAFYDFDTEQVWIPKMAAFQYGRALTVNDNRHRAVVKQLPKLSRMKFFAEFFDRYQERFNLPADFEGAPTPPPKRKLAAVSKPDESTPQLSLVPDDAAGNEESGGPVVTPAMLAAGYNEHCAAKWELPRVTVPLSKDRSEHAAARLREHPDPQWWATVFSTVGDCEFLTGTNPRGWRADFDFLMRPGSAERVLEGKYYSTQPVKAG